MVANDKMLEQTLDASDPELYSLIQSEKHRQKGGLEMIASENFTSVSVLQCLSSCLHNKYSEGLPGQRYYGGNEFIDKIESLCQERALSTYGLKSEEWGVNVQPYSGSPANFAVYTALCQPHDRIMGLDLPDGGHLTHGFMTSQKRISATSIYFESFPYKVDPQTGLINYDKLAENARLFKPKVIIAGISCYSRCLDYKRFREIADEVGAYLFSDMAHVSGLVAAGVIPSPFEYSDVVSTTTHKTLRGPRAGVIFFRKVLSGLQLVSRSTTSTVPLNMAIARNLLEQETTYYGVKSVGKDGTKTMYDLETRINNAVFPGLQGGPHNNAIAAIATSLKQASSQQFKDYQRQVIANAQRLCAGLKDLGYEIVTGGTDVHLLLVNVKPKGLSGAKAEFILEEVNIACNKNTVPGDKSALNPSGIRLGTPALTTRGFVEKDIDQVVTFIHAALTLALEAQVISGPKLVDFKRVVSENADITAKVKSLRSEIEGFASKFPLPGFTDY